MYLDRKMTSAHTSLLATLGLTLLALVLVALCVDTSRDLTTAPEAETRSVPGAVSAETINGVVDYSETGSSSGRMIVGSQTVPTLSVRVDDVAGEPVSNASVEVSPKGSLVGALRSSKRLRTTDADGNAKMTLPCWSLYDVVIARDSYGRQHLVTPPGSLHVRLAPSGHLDVWTIGHADHTPVPDVTIRFSRPGGGWWESRTDSRGYLKVDDLEAGTYRLSIRKEGYLGYEMHDVVIPGQRLAEPLEILLFPGLSLRGIVLDAETRMPIPEGRVEFYRGLTRAGGSSLDFDGSFVLGGLSNVGGRFRVISPGYDSFFHDAEVVPVYERGTSIQVVDALVTIPRTIQLSGIVRGDGVALTDATIFASTSGVLRKVAWPLPAVRDPVRVGVARTADDGSYTVDVPRATTTRRQRGVPPKFQLLAVSPGFSPRLIELDGDIASTHHVDIDLVSGATVGLRVSDPAGHPEQNARVRSLFVDPELPAQDHVYLAELSQPPGLTDRAGVATLRNMTKGTWHFEVVSSDGHRSAHRIIEIPRSGTVDTSIVVNDLGTVQGVVVDENNQQPIGYAEVFSQKNPILYRAQAGANGAFSMHVPWTGFVEIGVRGKEVQGEQSFSVLPGQVATLGVPRKEAAGFLGGVVRDSTTGNRIPIVDCELSFVRSWDGGLTVRSSTIAGGIFGVELPSHDSGAITFSAIGYSATRHDLQDLVMDDGRVTILLDPVLPLTNALHAGGAQDDGHADEPGAEH